MSRDFKLLICSLNWTSPDTTGHDTGLGTGLSLAGGSQGILSYFHTHIGSGHFLGFKILNFNTFMGFRKMTIFGVCRFCGYFWGQSQNWTIFRGHFYAF